MKLSVSLNGLRTRKEFLCSKLFYSTGVLNYTIKETQWPTKLASAGLTHVNNTMPFLPILERDWSIELALAVPRDIDSQRWVGPDLVRRRAVSALGRLSIVWFRTPVDNKGFVILLSYSTGC